MRALTAICVLWVISLGSLTLLAESAEAQVKRYVFRGKVKTIIDPSSLVDGSVQIGTTPYFGHWDMDLSEMILSDPASTGKLWIINDPLGIGVNFGQYQFRSTTNTIVVASNTPGEPAGYQVRAVEDVAQSLGDPLPGVEQTGFSVTFEDAGGTLLGDRRHDPKISSLLGSMKRSSWSACELIDSPGSPDCELSDLTVVQGDIATVRELVRIQAATVHWNHAIGAGPTPVDIALNLPPANRRNDAVVILTHHVQPFGTPFGATFDHAVALRFDATADRWEAYAADGTVMPSKTAVNALVVGDDDRRFVHTASGANTSGHITYLSHPYLDGNPDARILVTPNGSPGGVAIAASTTPIGVWYSSAAGKWTIYHQDTSVSMTAGLAFNVFVAPEESETNYVHFATAANSLGSYTTLDHPRFNGNPYALVYITQSFSPEGSPGIYNEAHVGVIYNPSSGRWRIINEDLSSMPIGAAFNVFSPDRETVLAQHRTLTANRNLDVTYPNLPDTTNSEGGTLQITLNLNPLFGTGVLNPRATGVWYDTTRDSAGILNQDYSTMSVDTVYNLYRRDFDARSFAHEATPENILAGSTMLQHPLLDDVQDAVFVVTPNWNPAGGGSGVDFDYPHDVLYDVSRDRWWIRNSVDSSTMPERASFNVLLAGPGTTAFQHIAVAGNTSGNTTTLDHPALNERSDQTLLIQNNTTGFGAATTLNPHPIAVQYSDALERWQILNQDGATIQTQTTFNVIALPEPSLTWQLLPGAFTLALINRRRCRSPKNAPGCRGSRTSASTRSISQTNSRP